MAAATAAAVRHTHTHTNCALPRNQRPRRVGEVHTKRTLDEHSPAPVGTGVSTAAERVGAGPVCFAFRPLLDFPAVSFCPRRNGHKTILLLLRLTQHYYYYCYCRFRRRQHVVRHQRAAQREDDAAVRRTVPRPAGAVGQGARGVQQADGEVAGVPADRRGHVRRGAGCARGGQQDQEHPVHVPAGAEEDQGLGAAAPRPVRGGGRLVAVRAQAALVLHTGLDDRRRGRQTPVLVAVHRRHAVHRLRRREQLPQFQQLHHCTVRLRLIVRQRLGRPGQETVVVVVGGGRTAARQEADVRATAVVRRAILQVHCHLAGITATEAVGAGTEGSSRRSGQVQVFGTRPTGATAMTTTSQQTDRYTPLGN